METIMTRIFIVGALILTLTVVLVLAGCDKEKIVESTQYIHDTQYLESPPDTVFQIDTVFVNDSVAVHTTDTVLIIDTVIQVNNVYDTIITYVTDTVSINQCQPSEFLALGALQYYCDPLVIEFINGEFGYDDGWIMYLSAFQTDVTKQSSDVYDIYGYIDYWTPDWSGYYPLEYYWRVTYTGGDPANPDNWDLSSPPDGVSGHRPGVSLTEDPARSDALRR
jgi:hypothetical protein